MLKLTCDGCHKTIHDGAAHYTLRAEVITRPVEHFCSFGCLAKFAAQACGWEIKKNA